MCVWQSESGRHRTTGSGRAAGGKKSGLAALAAKRGVVLAHGGVPPRGPFGGPCTWQGCGPDQRSRLAQGTRSTRTHRSLGSRQSSTSGLRGQVGHAGQLGSAFGMGGHVETCTARQLRRSAQYALSPSCPCRHWFPLRLVLSSLPHPRVACGPHSPRTDVAHSHVVRAARQVSSLRCLLLQLNWKTLHPVSLPSHLVNPCGTFPLSVLPPQVPAPSSDRPAGLGPSAACRSDPARSAQHVLFPFF